MSRDYYLRDKQPSLSEDDIDAIADRVVEATGRHKALTSTPPAIRWVQKWWWQVSIAFVGDHILHEIVAQYLRHK